MVRRSGSIDSAIWNSHSLKVPVNSDNNHSPLLSKAKHIGYIKMACRLLLLTRHCLRTCSFFLVLQTVHSFVGTLYLVFLLLVINSTMGELCCLEYSFFFFLLVKSPVKPKQMWRSAKLGWWTFVRLGGRRGRFQSYEIPFMPMVFRYWNSNFRIIKSWKWRDSCSNLMSFTFR